MRTDKTLLVTHAAYHITKILCAGDRSHPNEDWADVDLHENLDHAIEHIARYQSGDTSEPHLAHALTRLAMALFSREYSE